MVVLGMARFAEPKERAPIDPQDVTVQLNVGVPWHYREQLAQEAAEQKMSLNRLVVNALVRIHPPKRK